MSAHDQPLRGVIPVTTANAGGDWNVVYRRELPRVYNYFRYRLGDDALAEDLTSATFEKAWRGRQKYRRDLAAFSTWLFTIARNVATDHLRSRRVLVSFDTLRNVPAPGSPHEAYAQHAELEQLGALLNRLTDHERELIALKYGAERTNREIAGHLGMSESNVGTTLYRLVNKLRAQWSEGVLE
jgi:RNA polymerase sigma-70 factor (ECF subfamily)